MRCASKTDFHSGHWSQGTYGAGRLDALLAIYTDIMRAGRSSITLAVETWVLRRGQGERVKVTAAEFVLVAVDEAGRPRALPP